MKHAELVKRIKKLGLEILECNDWRDLAADFEIDYETFEQAVYSYYELLNEPYEFTGDCERLGIDVAQGRIDELEAERLIENGIFY